MEEERDEYGIIICKHNCQKHAKCEVECSKGLCFEFSPTRKALKERIEQLTEWLDRAEQQLDDWERRYGDE